ncbi:GDP-mannose 4,6-dehydratase [Methanoregula sp.]|uniref:GDP-mannose 4,6-dehydratase n=1 Tax=Methanoregula sp. TaxID=2052170 RepID=UPI00236E7AA8|nr:GDP-mannose 4,6-dehydratase [Methanoregula sp.]MDD1687135.1 GDP-mannose 4,6-dehydratase [Methanoregula sp.]
MKKLLITGISGFVGGHMVDFLTRNRQDLEIHGISRSQPAWDFVPARPKLLTNHYFHKADLLDIPKIKSFLEKVQPDYILHMAAQSSVAESWKTPVFSFMNNTNIFLNIIDTVRLNDNGARVLSIGSSEQYGVVSEENLPLSEETPQHPANPYAVARVAQEQLAKIYADGYGLDICCTRSFNHCGPGQTDRFVVSAIVKQFVKIAHGLQDPVIHIGNGSIVRDFVDVHDVVVAYDLLLSKGKRGEIYNVCSGTGRTINEIITLLSAMKGIDVKVHEEMAQMRPIDNPRIIGSNEKIRRDLGWKPEIPFEKSLESMYHYWDLRMRQELPHGKIIE